MFVYNYANNADHTLNKEGLGMKSLSLSRSGMLLQTHKQTNHYIHNMYGSIQNNFFIMEKIIHLLFYNSN